MAFIAIELGISVAAGAWAYLYRTYFQHYNEPPIEKVILKGRHCSTLYISEKFVLNITSESPTI
jgi:hypothetical protein